MNLRAIFRFIVLAIAISATQVHGFGLGRLGAGMGSLGAVPRAVPAWVLPAASVDLDFANGRYYGGALADLISVSRGSTGYVTNADGSLTLVQPNLPRIGGGTGLLVEESRTNLVISSQAFNNAAWSAGGVTAADNTGIAPDGTLTASTLTQKATTENHLIQSGTSPAFTSGSVYAASLFAKAGTGQFLQIILPGGAFGTAQYANFDLIGGAVTASAGGVVARIDPYINGWFRISIALAAVLSSGGSATSIVPILSGNAARNPSYLGTGATFLIWGAQTELGAAPSS